MPAHARSLHITDTYRRHVQTVRRQGVVLARERWAATLDPQDLDKSHAEWVASVAPALTTLQRTSGRLSLAYLTAYLRSETGRHAVAPPVSLAARVGVARTGKPLTEALFPSLLTVKGAIGAGATVSAALKLGLDRASRVAGEEVRAPARDVLSEAMQADDRIVGWQRVTSGGCGACLAAADGAVHADDDFIEVHDNCECDTEPVVANTPQHVERPTGHAMFQALPHDAQDALLGAQKAALVRSGDVPFHDLVQHDPMSVLPDGITEAPLHALT